MKFNKSSNAILSIIMTICILAFSIVTYVAIAVSMKNVYTDAIKDMISVAIDNIEEHVKLHINECVFLTKTQSFINLTTHYDEGTEGSPSGQNDYNQTFSYIYAKVQNTKTIDKIMYVDETQKILLSSDAKDLNTYINKDSNFTKSNLKGIVNVTIQKSDTNKNVIIISQPVKLYDKTVGNLYMQLNFDFIDNLLKNYKFGKSGNLFLISNESDFIGYDKSALPSSLAKVKDDDNINSLLSSKTNNYSRIYQTEFKTDMEKRYMIYSALKNINVIVASSIAMPEVHQTAFKTAFPMIFLLLVIFMMLLFYRYIISKKILHPLALLNRSLYMLKKGDLRARYNYNEDNEFGNLSCVFNQTISNLQRTTLDLKKRESRNDILLNNVTDVIWEYNIETGTIKMPENWSKLLGIDYANADYLYTIESMMDYVHFNDRDDLSYYLSKCIKDDNDFNIDVKMKRTDDTYIWVRIMGSCMYNIYNEPYQVIGSLFDITEDKKREDSLKQSATRDDMTLLLKKVEMERLIDIDLNNTDYGHFLLILDLDSFKQINDTYGHLAGDEIIIHTANVLKSLCGTDCYLCRFGGDEFIIYTETDYTVDDVKKLAATIISELNKGCNVNSNLCIKICCSIGISQSPKDGNSYVSLISKADLAIYHVKKHEKNQYAFYTDGFN